jgi:lipopolysaccharide export system permease protein
MGNIITSYLARELVKSSAATLLVLLVILISNALGRVLADIADGDIPQQALWPVMLSQSISILSLLLPIGVFLGIVFAFGRMYRDHEIVVMHACGIGYRDFYRPLALVVVPLLLFSAYASVWLSADVQTYAQGIVDREENLHEFEQIRPGQFNQSESDKHIFYMESISEDRLELRDIIISRNDQERAIFETAKTGRHRVDEKNGDLFLVVGPGKRYEGVAVQRDYRIIEFDQHGILIERKRREGKAGQRSEEKSPGELLASGNLNDRVEFHWRIAIPVALVVLAVLAVPLAYVAPRQGRYGKVGYALLVYVVYMNLMAVTRARLESGEFPLAINFWWVHGLFILLALGLIYRRNRGVVFDRVGA